MPLLLTIVLYVFIVLSFFIPTFFVSLDKKYHLCNDFDMATFHKFNSIKGKGSESVCDKRIVEYFGENYEILILNDKYHNRPIQSEDIYIETAKRLNKDDMRKIRTKLIQRINIAIKSFEQEQLDNKNKSKTDYENKIKNSVSNVLKDIR